MKKLNVAIAHKRCHTIWAWNHESGSHHGWSGTPVPHINTAPKNEANPTKNHGVYVLFIFGCKLGINAGAKYRSISQLFWKLSKDSITGLPKSCWINKTVKPEMTLPNRLGNLTNTSVAIQRPMLNSNKLTPIPSPESKNQ